MTHTFVNGTCHLAALGVSQGYVHIAGGNGGGHGFKSVSHGDCDVRFDIFKLGGQLHNAHTGGLGHGGWIFTLDNGVNDRVNLKTIFLDLFGNVAKAPQQS